MKNLIFYTKKQSNKKLQNFFFPLWFFEIFAPNVFAKYAYLVLNRHLRMGVKMWSERISKDTIWHPASYELSLFTCAAIEILYDGTQTLSSQVVQISWL